MNVITIQRPLRKNRRVTVRLPRRSIREISRDYFGRERDRHVAVETVLFLILAAISAWPVLACADALRHLLENGGT